MLPTLQIDLAGIYNRFWLVVAVLVGILAVLLPAWLPMFLLAVVLVGILVLREPLVGLFFMLVLGPWGAVEALIIGPSPLDSGQLLFFGTVGLWLIRGLTQHRITLPKTKLLAPFGLFLIIAGISLYNAVAVMAGMNELVKWIEIAILLWIVPDMVANSPFVSQFKPQKQLQILLGMLIAASLTQAFLGIFEFAFLGVGVDHFRITGRFYRAFGTFIQPNPYGGYIGVNLALSAGILIGLLAYQQQHPSWLKTRSEKIWLGFIIEAVIFLTFALISSWSRGAWMGFAGALAILIYFASPQRRWLAVLSAIFSLLLFISLAQARIVPSAFLDRITNGLQYFAIQDVRGEVLTPQNHAALERLAHWQAAQGMARDYLWWGVGFGNYETAYADYALPNWDNPLGHAHNYYLNLMAEVGFIGTIAYLLLWGAIIWQALRLLWHLDWHEKGIALGFLAAWGALSLHHLVDKLYVNNFYLHLGVMLAAQQMLANQAKLKPMVWKRKTKYG